ncbi:MAG: hypothetical protein ACRCUY_05895, partial [Thermoguttaceae bacterium]
RLVKKLPKVRRKGTDEYSFCKPKLFCGNYDDIAANFRGASAQQWHCPTSLSFADDPCPILPHSA